MPEISREALNFARLEAAKLPSYSTYSALANLVENNGSEYLLPVKIAVLRNFTIEPFLPVLLGELVLSDLNPTFGIGDFDSVAAAVFNSDSSLYRDEPNYILNFSWLETLSSVLSSRFCRSTSQQINAEIDRLVSSWRSMLSAIREKSKAPVIFNNFPIPLFPGSGILDAQSDQGIVSVVHRLNSALASLTREFSDFYLVDFCQIFSRIGYENAVDERHWQIARSPINQKAMIPLANEFGKVFRALLGKISKCLVLDCDNTLWGGVVGEDGLDGIKIGASYPGSSYLSFQEEILNLHHRGILLALNSKNNEQDVLEVLNQHPDMIIKESHLACWQVNWDDKATNLRRIASELNIGIDSLVFADDSAHEIGWVKSELPEIRTILLEGPSYLFRGKLLEKGFFDGLTFSDEDLKRNEMVAGDKKRKALKESTGSMEDYLASLEIKIEIGLCGEKEIPRVSQLTQKTNQFNLTTKRYSIADIERFVKSDSFDVLFLKVNDKIADLGLVGVAILNFESNFLIDSFLLSCRVLGRGIENVFLRMVFDRFLQRDINQIKANYIPTKKNAQVADFYQKFGFEPITNSSEKSEYRYDLDGLNDNPIEMPSWLELKKY
jgi:FkbH-like protein